MNSGIPSKEDYIAEFDTISEQLITQTMEQNPSGMIALKLRLDTERMLIETILSLRDMMYGYADILDAELDKLRHM